MLSITQAYSQLPQEKELTAKLVRARNDEEKVDALSNLAELYSSYKDNKKAAGVLEKQMLLAEFSQNEELILKTLSGTAISNIASWSSKETFDQAMSFSRRALEYAKQ
ncbi:MAG TPA: hypothetical protein VER36_04760, partial [Flavisolibacter sp.]|nr:hypothetical protein [Flavisolibacter sp.]